MSSPPYHFGTSVKAIAQLRKGGGNMKLADLELRVGLVRDDDGNEVEALFLHATEVADHLVVLVADVQSAIDSHRAGVQGSGEVH